MPPISIAELQTALAPANQGNHVASLGKYFTHGGIGRSGSLFESFGGRGDVGADANRFTYTDCMAPSFLSVNTPALAAHSIVEGTAATSTSSLLAGLPTGVPLDTNSWAPVADSANSLFQLLKSFEDVGYVTASKLIARKRPELIPILDSVVYDAFSLPQKVIQAWAHFASLVSDPTVHASLVAIKNAAVAQYTPARYPNAHNLAGLSTLSLIRVLDICVWEEHRSHLKIRPQNCIF